MSEATFEIQKLKERVDRLVRDRKVMAGMILDLATGWKCLDDSQIGQLKRWASGAD